MIKKTFKTIFKNPTIILFFAIVFVMSILSKTVHSYLIEGFARSYNPTMDTLLYIYVTRLERLLIPLAMGIFIFAPMLYFAALKDKGDVQKGWYKQGIKRNWWRFLVVWISIYAVRQLTNYAIELFIRPSILSGASDMGRIPYLYLAVSVIFALITYFIAAPVIAEDNFADGFRNSRIVGRRYFFKMLLVYLLVSMLMYILPVNPAILFAEPVSAVVSSLVTSFVSVFMYVYSMNLYVTEKEKLEPSCFS